MPRFTDRFISSFAPIPPAKDRLAFDTECRGLGIRASSSGNKTFLVQWTDAATGRKVREPLGAWGALTIEKAREAARIRLGRLAAGFDPKAERDAKRAEDARQRADAETARKEAAFTLEVLISEWERLHLAARRASYATRAPRTLRLAFAEHLDKPASHLAHGDALAAIDDRVADGQPNAARLILTAGRACYGWAVKRRRLALNPFAGLPPIEGAYVQRERFLDDAEVGEVWRAAGTLPSPHGPLVRFLLLTLARRDEAGSMVWGELTPDLSKWAQPAARTKNGRAHLVQLSPPARAILRDQMGAKPKGDLPPLPPADRLVFGINGSDAVPPQPITSQSWMKRNMEKAIGAERAKRAEVTGEAPEPMPAWVFHDFRRTGVTWLAGAGFPPHVADRLLNHVQGTIRGVAAIYQRNEFLAERKAALDAWAEHVMACAERRGTPVKVASLDRERKRRRVP
ncbi:site-specific integrase [Roseococcus sp. SYP-B2431]|uniref:tyrosine-type recombinase/integrase n=1 Tax=Roseococcus sp. SYP-B2431 TaxID=2496640 RepID=UPI00103E997D|nr:site-specific integrase [Roseococcus sp. SYP-B2431]TCH97626.1 site-specific integrase [Roseococcus sp. SYP-B2431]